LEINVTNVSESKFIKQTLLNIKITNKPKQNNISYFNNPLLLVDVSHRQKKINKEATKLNGNIGQRDSTSTYGVCYPIATEYISFSASHKIFFKIHHILGHKASLKKYERTEITS
jgi:hypothetical protein